MRLIDADELKISHCKECTLYPNQCLKDNCDWGSIYHIEKAKTIDAIPIEWIKRYIQTLPINPTSRDVRMMIEYWRNENETD